MFDSNNWIVEGKGKQEEFMNSVGLNCSDIVNMPMKQLVSDLEFRGRVWARGTHVEIISI